MSDPASLIAQAEKLLKARSGAFSFFSGSSSDKTEEAVELFKKAGFGYRSRKEYRNSGKVYDRAAEVAEDVFEKVRSSKEASKSYKMGDRDDVLQAIRSLENVARFAADRADSREMATARKDIAEIYKNLGFNRKAFEAYCQAVEDYKLEGNSTASVRKLLDDAAEIAALEGVHPTSDDQIQAQYSCDLKGAAEMMEELASGNVRESMLRYSVKGNLLKAGLCRLALEAAKKRDMDMDPDPNRPVPQIEQYKRIDETFGSTRECHFLEGVFRAVQAGDEQMFLQHLSDFDRITPLNNFQTSLLLNVRTCFSREDDLL